MATRQRTWWAAAALCAIAAAASVLLWQARAIPITSVAVPPFHGPEAEARGITEEVIDCLARVPGLRIETETPAPRAVDAVVDAAIEESAGRVRVLLHLNRVDGRRNRARAFERPHAELSGLAVEVAGFIAPEARQRAAKHKTPAAAYALYLEGRYWFERQDVASLRTAIERFQQSTDADPDFAAGWAWLAMARAYLADTGAVRPNEILPSARDAAERAVTMGEQVPEAHAALAIVRLEYDWDWEGARRELDRAQQLAPGSRLAAHWRERWREAMHQSPAPDPHFANLPALHDDAEARKLLQDADDIRVEEYISPAALALVANSLHDIDGLFHWLDVAYDERSVQLPYVVWNASLPARDPRLTELLHRMKLPAAE